MSTVLEDMNDVIEKLTNFVEYQYTDKPKILESKFNINVSTGNEGGNNMSWSEITKVPNNTEIHHALNEVLTEVDKIANQPFEFPPLRENNEESPKSIQQMFKKPLVEKDFHSPTPKSKVDAVEANKSQSRNAGIYRICRDKKFGTYEKEANPEIPQKSIEDHLITVQRLYETQMNYDKNLEDFKYQSLQNVMNLNKSKPSINSNSTSLMTKCKDWKPIFIRTPEVIEKCNRDIEKLREQLNKERIQKEADELAEIERNKIGRNKNKTKTAEVEWDIYYNKRFNDFNKNKNKRMQLLDEKWNHPNQAIPTINKTPKRSKVSNKDVYSSVSERLMNFADIKIEKLKVLENSLTPKFKPNINKNSEKILKNSSKKSRNIQQRLRQYNSLNIVSNLSIRFNNKANTEDFSDIVQDYNTKNNMFYGSKGTDEARTKVQTDESASTLTYNTKNVIIRDDFRNFIDTYEQTISSQINVNEKQENIIGYDSNKFDLFNPEEDVDKEPINQDLNYGTNRSREIQYESYNNKEDNSEEELYQENQTNQMQDNHTETEESKHSSSSNHEDESNEDHSNPSQADEASLKQSAEALVNEITIRDIMNPNLDSTHSFKPKSKNSESSNIDKSNKTSSKRNSKGSAFEYQSMKESKDSNIEILNGKGAKRPSGILQSLQPLSNKEIARSMTAIDKNKSNDGSVKLPGNSKRGSEFARIESEKPLEVINEHHSEQMETPTPAKQIKDIDENIQIKKDKILFQKLKTEGDFLIQSKLERNSQQEESKHFRSQDDSVKLNDSNLNINESMDHQNIRDDFKDVISEGSNGPQIGK